MRKAVGVFILAAMVMFSWDTGYPQEMKEINKSFEVKKNIRIETVSGDCVIKAGDAGKITVQVEYAERIEDSFEADIQEKSNSLRIKERWYGRNSGG